MDPALFRILLPLLFALIVLPLVIRFIIGRLVFLHISRQHMKPLLTELLDSEKDIEAYKAFGDFLRGKINAPYMRTYQIREDLKTILLTVQNVYSGGDSGEHEFSFSVSDLIKCAFLLMNDLNDMFRRSRRFRRIGRSRIATFRRINKISGYYNIIYEKIPFLKLLRQGRITGKIVRILLIPLIGLPSVLISILASILSLLFTEIIWRYYYSLLLVKCFTYTAILYGDRKGIIGERLKGFSSKRIRKESALVEELINPRKDISRSSLFEEAYIEYQKVLVDFGISPERDMDFNGVTYKFNGKRRRIRNILHIPLRAAGRFIPQENKKADDRERILMLVRAIARPYNSRERFYDNLRLVDLFDSLYMISLLGYSRLLSGSFLLNNLSVDFLLTAGKINDEIVNQIIRKRFPRLREYYRSFRLYRKSRYLYRALRSGNAAGLLLSVSGPIAMEGIRSGIRDYIFRRVGRMALYCFDSRCLKRDRLFGEELRDF